jgi:hypothetical protein
VGTRNLDGVWGDESRLEEISRGITIIGGGDISSALATLLAAKSYHVSVVDSVPENKEVSFVCGGMRVGKSVSIELLIDHHKMSKSMGINPLKSQPFWVQKQNLKGRRKWGVNK